MWTKADLHECLAQGRIEWRKHALVRTLERSISREEVITTLSSAAILTTYPDDRPTPSALVGKASNPPLHVVVAGDVKATTCFVITVYRPDSKHFEADLKTMNAQCPLCGGTRTDGTTTFTAELGFGIVVVRHVPARVCVQCGEG
jgi:YgiT-type zinc finger domain-containing protein